MWSKMDSELEDIARKCGLKGHTASPGCYEAPSNFSLQSIGNLLSDKKISIIAMLHFDVIVRRVMALSLERRNLFFFAKKLLDERWEVVRSINTSGNIFFDEMVPKQLGMWVRYINSGLEEGEVNKK
jgi:hypothetical protein